MKKILPQFIPLVAIVLSLHTSIAMGDEKFWNEGSDQPNNRVNVDLKNLSPKAYLNVSEKVNESVVNISTTKVVQNNMQNPFGFPGQGDDQNPFAPFFGQEFFGKFFNQQPMPKNRKEASLGSGFIINKDGYIVTNNHVISQADEITVTFSDESEAVAKLIGRDPKSDVALIKVEHLPAKADPVILGDSDAMKVGEIVVAIGNPFGLTHSVTQGIISAKERAIGLGPYDDFIQTDASINPGNSGGPLLNIYGEVIGINTAMHAGGQGIGFAIPINSAKEILRKLKNEGKVVRSQLGIQIQKINDDHVKALKLKDKDGALISQVMEGSPAEKAGIKAGDVIVSYDEKKIRDWHMLPLLVSNTQVGKRVKIDLIRNSTLKTVIAQVSELKDEDDQEAKASSPQTPKQDALGLTVQPLTKEMTKSLGVNEKQKGVVVSSVDPDSVVYSKGIRRGDILIEVNRQNVTNVEEYSNAVKNLKKGDSVLLLIVRKQGTLFVAFGL